jgi:hypothetical protein
MKRRTQKTCFTFLFQSAQERNRLPDLFFGKDAFPGHHGGAFLTGGNSPFVLNTSAPAVAASAPRGLVLPAKSAGTESSATTVSAPPPPQAASISAASMNTTNKIFFIYKPPVNLS